MPALFALLHHLFAFTLVAAIAVEFVLIRNDLDARNVRRLALTDALLGMSATALLVVGLLRVFYFEKGAAYYFQNAAFLAKLALFIAVALLSIYPTLKFLKWRRAPEPEKARVVRRILHLELAGVVVILLFAVLMARGIGFLG